MKVLVIGYVWPEPKSSAAGSHICSIMQCFINQGWQVEFASPAQQTPHMIDLGSLSISSKEILLNSDCFDEYIGNYNPDIVMFDRFMMEEQFGWRVDKVCPNAVKILDTEDLQCLRHARHNAHKQKRDITQHDLCSDLAKREIASIYRCDISLIISQYELTLLDNTYNVSQDLLHYLPFIFDPNKLSETPNFDDRSHFVTIGNFRHAPNWDSVLWLHAIWPQIKKALPSAEMHIYGSYPPPKATGLTNKNQGFFVKGWCDDAYDVIKNARVLLSPLRFGAGTKGKFLDAMACQTPSVTTSVGSEGMILNEQWPGLIAETELEIVNAAINLYQDQELWQTLSDLCHLNIEKKFNKHQYEPLLIERILDVKKSLINHRENNFTGLMLKHHNHASTKYMSQWITEKNKNK